MHKINLRCILSYSYTMSSIKQHLIQNCKDFYSNDIPNGDIAFYLRALTAKILWAIFVYSLVVNFVPINDFLLQNATAIVFLAIVTFFWRVVKNHIPPAIDHCLSGEIFFKTDSVKELNIYIAGLIILNTFSIFGLPKIVNSTKHE